MAMDSELIAFSAWSLLSLTATAHGVLAYPDELGVRYEGYSGGCVEVQGDYG